jgi:hypothetical protein
MSFMVDNIKAYYSGAVSLDGVQADPSQSLGGYKSSSEVVNFSFNNLFPNVSGADTISGSTTYRAFFVKNENYEIWRNPKIYIYDVQGSSYENVYFGLEDSISGQIQIIPNEEISPTGIAWYNPLVLASGVAIGNVLSQGYFGVWVKKEVIPSSGTGTKNHNFTLAFTADVIS